MKTKEALNAVKEEIETVNKKFTVLSDDELEQVSGGGRPRVYEFIGIGTFHCPHCLQAITGTLSQIDAHIAACSADIVR